MVDWLNIDILINENKKDLTELEELIGYRFTDLRLLHNALIHSSYAFEQAQGGKDNQILEFVGDAECERIHNSMTPGQICAENPRIARVSLPRLKTAASAGETVSSLNHWWTL